ncbi:hypothetical protein OF83DRAFT_1089469, partial [Amylostereum chailletii]
MSPLEMAVHGRPARLARRKFIVVTLMHMVWRMEIFARPVTVTTGWRTDLNGTVLPDRIWIRYVEVKVSRSESEKVELQMKKGRSNCAKTSTYKHTPTDSDASVCNTLHEGADGGMAPPTPEVQSLCSFAPRASVMTASSNTSSGCIHPPPVPKFTPHNLEHLRILGRTDNMQLRKQKHRGKSTTAATSSNLAMGRLRRRLTEGQTVRIPHGEDGDSADVTVTLHARMRTVHCLKKLILRGRARGEYSGEIHLRCLCDPRKLKPNAPTPEDLRSLLDQDLAFSPPCLRYLGRRVRKLKISFSRQAWTPEMIAAKIVKSRGMQVNVQSIGQIVRCSCIRSRMAHPTLDDLFVRLAAEGNEFGQIRYLTPERLELSR